MLNSPWDRHLGKKRVSKSWQNPLRVFWVVFVVILALLMGLMIVGASGEVFAEQPVQEQKVFDILGFHPERGTAGMMPCLDKGTVAVFNYTQETLRVSMGKVQGDFIWTWVLEPRTYAFFYGVTGDTYTVAWAALSHESMFHGARVIIIEEDILHDHWVDRNFDVAGKTNEELMKESVKFYTIAIYPGGEDNSA
jgi:hypothetical protein